ncbi:MAG: exo-alpha-sialidase, partial [Bacteroidales bacterium]|nr:exo-alpha-sialidase [Bacteroidales bacterium]
EPITVIEGQGRYKGYGDPVIAQAEDGTVICGFSGGAGLWWSTEETPMCNYIIKSTDGGQTWGEPLNITDIVRGKTVKDTLRKKLTSAFFGSGNGVVLKQEAYKGRILFVLALASSSYRLYNYACYSDDGGDSWTVSELAYDGGDEAKIIELKDGRLLMSVRQSGLRGYSYSEDGGQTWKDNGRWADMNTNACDGDIIRYDDGLILHSLTNSLKRENVSIFCSFDEAQTWPYVKTICPYQSVYSSITKLPDGTIGAFIEENPEGACELWYMNFSKEWLMAGQACGR